MALLDFFLGKPSAPNAKGRITMKKIEIDGVTEREALNEIHATE
jgi:hypothetical protein